MVTFFPRFTGTSANRWGHISQDSVSSVFVTAFCQLNKAITFHLSKPFSATVANDNESTITKQTIKEVCGLGGRLYFLLAYFTLLFSKISVLVLKFVVSPTVEQKWLPCTQVTLLHGSAFWLSTSSPPACNHLVFVPLYQL